MVPLLWLLLGIQRWGRRWPFEPQDKGWRATPDLLAAAAGLAGAGCGLFQGLLHQLDYPRHVHFAALVDYAVMVPAALLAITLAASLPRALVALLAFFLAAELGGQLGIHHGFSSMAGSGYWDDITAGNGGFLVGGAAFAGLVWAVRRVRGRPAPDDPQRGPLSRREKLTGALLLLAVVGGLGWAFGWRPYAEEQRHLRELRLVRGAGEPHLPWLLESLDALEEAVRAGAIRHDQRGLAGQALQPALPHPEVTWQALVDHYTRRTATSSSRSRTAAYLAPNRSYPRSYGIGGAFSETEEEEVWGQVFEEGTLLLGGRRDVFLGPDEVYSVEVHLAFPLALDEAAD